MSLLETIIANHGGPRIVSEQHDLGAINWVAGVSDPGEMISCGYLPAARRQEGEQDAEYEQRIRPLLMALPAEQRDKIMGAAINRAGLDTANGRVNVVCVVGPNGERSPWHKLGVGVAEALSAEDAARLGGLAWEVVKIPAKYNAAGRDFVSDETFVLVRADTGAQLGATGARYQPIQNAAGFDFLDSVLKEFGAKYETAGSLFGGKQVWMQARLPASSFTLLGKDTTEAFATFTLDHTGSGADCCFPTALRAVCANTLRVAGKSKGKGIRIPHVGDVKSKIRAARVAMGLAVEELETFAETAVEMVRFPLSVQELGNAVLDNIVEFTQAQIGLGTQGILDTVLQVTAANRDLEAKRVDRELRKRASILDDIVERYETARCEPKGSAWSALNAVTESANWGKWGKERADDKESRRLDSILVGERDDAQQFALNYVQNAMSV
jgi:phage/plasmid-like protein (TIGR03299 family)